MPTLTQTRRAFTLIELLVVLAVIAVLAVLLFPVFARVRENGRKTTCLNNLKQLGTAFTLYITDYDGHYPDFLDYSTPQGVPASWDVLILPYAKSPSVLQCASDSTSRRFHLPGNASAVYRSYGFTYNLSKAAGRGTTHEVHIPKPSLTVLLAETNATLSDGSIATWNYNQYMENLGEQVAWRHNETANFLFVDGHVKAKAGDTKGAYPQFEGYSYSINEGSLCGDGKPLPQ